MTKWNMAKGRNKKRKRKRVKQQQKSSNKKTFKHFENAFSWINVSEGTMGARRKKTTCKDRIMNTSCIIQKSRHCNAWNLKNQCALHISHIFNFYFLYKKRKKKNRNTNFNWYRYTAHIERESKYQSISDTMFLAHFQEFGYMRCISNE